MTKALAAFGVLVCSVASAQVVDTYPRSISSVAALPAICERVGELVWLSTASAGLNLYGSTTAGGSCVWTVLSGTPGPTGPPGTSGTGSGTVTVVGAGNLTSTQLVSGGGSSTLQTPSANATVSSGGNIQGTAYTTSTGNPVPFGPTTAVVSNGTCWNSTTGLSVKDCGYVPVTNARTITTTAPITGTGDLSANRTIACPTCTILIASGTVALGTTAIASGNCATTVTATATGALSTDVAQASVNADISGVTGYTPLTTGTLSIMPPWLTSNLFSIKVCNNTAAAITPGAVSVNWRVAR